MIDIEMSIDAYPPELLSYYLPRFKKLVSASRKQPSFNQNVRKSYQTVYKDDTWILVHIYILDNDILYKLANASLIA